MSEWTMNFSLIVRLDLGLIYTELTNRSKFSSVHNQYTFHSILIFPSSSHLSISKIWLFFCEDVVKKNETYFEVKINAVKYWEYWYWNFGAKILKILKDYRKSLKEFSLLKNMRHLRISNDKNSLCINKNLTN